MFKKIVLPLGFIFIIFILTLEDFPIGKVIFFGDVKCNSDEVVQTAEKLGRSLVAQSEGVFENNVDFKVIKTLKSTASDSKEKICQAKFRISVPQYKEVDSIGAYKVSKPNIFGNFQVELDGSFLIDMYFNHGEEDVQGWNYP